MLGNQRAREFKGDSTLNRVGEFEANASASLFGQVWLRKGAASAPLVSARDLECPLVAATSRIGNDRARRIDLDLAAVELVDTPSLGAVLECVLLLPSAARCVRGWLSHQEANELLEWRGRHRQQVDLFAVGRSQ